MATFDQAIGASALASEQAVRPCAAHTSLERKALMKINGQALRKCRESRLLTVVELSNQASISTQSLYLIERGKQTKIDNIRRLVEALDLSPEEALASGLIYKD
jgi:predicted transcriptional regulator